MRNRLIALIWITALLVLALPVSSVAAQGEFDYFTSASSTCTSGTFTFIAPGIASNPLGFARLQFTSSVVVEAIDEANNFLGSQSLSATPGQT